MNTPIETQPPIAPQHTKPPTNGWKVFGISVIVVAVLGLVGYWVITQYLFPSEFKPVSLSRVETQQLNTKLSQLNLPTVDDTQTSSEHSPLTPEKYSELGANREVTFSEKEINALLAHNTDMADKLAIDLSDNLASAKLLMPLEPDFPIMGGKTLKLTAGVEIAFRDSRPIVKLRGVSLWGVPVPNAWLGNLKNVDLINEFGSDPGFWQSFSDGIEFIQVVEGNLVVKLKP